MSHYSNGNYQVDVKPLKPLSRGVSIIGVGATPFMKMLEDPDFQGLTEGGALRVRGHRGHEGRQCHT